MIDARRFGVVADGVTDDTAALQLAIDAAEASTDNRTVLLPRGTMIVNPATASYAGTELASDYALLISDSNVTLQGHGWESIISGDGDTGSFIYCVNDAADPSNVVFRDFKLVSTGTQTSGGGTNWLGIASLANNTLYDRVYFENIGVNIYSTATFSEMEIRDCYFNNYVSTGVRPSLQTKMTGCIFDGMGWEVQDRDTVDFGHAIYTGTDVERLIIDNNHFRNMSGVGLHVFAGTLRQMGEIIFSNNVCTEYVAAVQIYGGDGGTSSPSGGVVITGNSFNPSITEDGTRASIYIDSTSQCSITNNSFYSDQAKAGGHIGLEIRSQSAGNPTKNVQVIGNSFFGFDYGMYFGNVQTGVLSNISVSHNTFINCPIGIRFYAPIHGFTAVADTADLFGQGDTITVSAGAIDVDLVEGVDWTADASNRETTAASITSAIDGVANVEATTNGRWTLVDTTNGTALTLATTAAYADLNTDNGTYDNMYNVHFDSNVLQGGPDATSPLFFQLGYANNEIVKSMPCFAPRGITFANNVEAAWNDETY